MLTEVGLIEAEQTNSHNHEIPDRGAPVFFRQQSSREAYERMETGDSHSHRGSSGILGPDFRLNAPIPDDGEENDQVDPPPNREPTGGVTRHFAMDSDSEPTRSLSLSAPNGVTPVVSPSKEENNLQNHFETTAQNAKSEKRGWSLGHRHKKVTLLAFASLITLLLAAIIVIIVLALNQSTSSGTKSNEETNSGSSPNNAPVPTTLDLIKARGNLACGVVPYAGFSMLDNSTETWSGFEIDLVSF